MSLSKNNTVNQAIAIRLLARLADHADSAEHSEKKHGLTELHVSAFNNSFEKTKKLLQNNMNPNIIDELGWTPLHDAAIQGNTEIVKLLLEAGANVNAQDKEDLYTPLHDAARMNHSEIVRLLLACGADTSLKDRWNNTPLNIAQEYKFEEIVDLLS